MTRPGHRASSLEAPVGLRACCAVLLLAGVVLTASGPALAQSGGAAVDPPVATAGHLDRNWAAYRAHPPTSDAAADAFVALERTAHELGVATLPLHALALLADARDAIEAGNHPLARVLVDRAERLAPDLPATRFTAGWLAARSAPLNPFGGLLQSRAGWDALLAQPATAHAPRTFLHDAARHGLLAFALLSALALFVRRWRHAALDLRVASRFTLTPSQSAFVVLAAAIAAPALLHSPALLPAGLVAVCATTCNLRERLVAALSIAAAFGAVAIVPLQVQLASPSTDATRIAMAASTPCDDACRRHLHDRLDSPLHASASLALAWLHWRDGRPDDRRRAAERLAETPWPDDLQPWVRFLQGNLAYAARDADEAERAWEEALHGLPPADQIGVLINLARLARDRGDTESVRQLTAELLASGDPRAARMLDERGGRSQNLVLAGMVSLPPAPQGTEAHVEWRKMAEDDLARSTRGRMGNDLLLSLSLGVLAWLVLGALLHGLGWTARSCRRCGTPTSRLLHPPSASAGFCVGCNQLDLSSAQLSRNQQRRRESRIELAREHGPRIATVAAVVLPGPALIATGRPLLGAIVLAPLAAGLGLLQADRTLLQVASFTELVPFFDGVIPLAAVLIGGAMVLSTVTMVVTLPGWQR